MKKLDVSIETSYIVMRISLSINLAVNSGWEAVQKFSSHSWVWF